MTYIAPDTATVRIVQNQDSPIAHRVYLEDEAIPALVQADCGFQVVDAEGANVGTSLAATWDGATATLSGTLPASATSAESLAGRAWGVLVTVSGPDGDVVHHRRARLVRRVVPSTLLSSELVSRYPELGNIRTTAQLRAGIAEAFEDLAQDLEVRGVLLDQITDPAWRHRAHYLRAAAGEYMKAASDTQGESFQTTAMALKEHYLAQLDEGIPYDADHNGVEDTAKEQAVNDGWFHATGRRS